MGSLYGYFAFLLCTFLTTGAAAGLFLDATNPFFFFSSTSTFFASVGTAFVFSVALKVACAVEGVGLLLLCRLPLIFKLLLTLFCDGVDLKKGLLEDGVCFIFPAYEVV